MRRFLQRVIGLALLGEVTEHILPILVGEGANGKGVLYGACSHALGDYADAAEPELFVAREGAHPAGQMDLLGRRMVVVSELDKGVRLAEATLKRLTGGDRIKARFMGKNFVSFTPSHTAFLVTNDLPKVSGDDDAVWRRLRVVPFDVVVPPKKRDVHLPDRLELEAEAVLAWAVEGYAEYVRRGRLDEPESVLVRTKKYRTDFDAVTRFLEECCSVAPGNVHVKATTKDLHERFNAWARTEGVDPLSSKAFGQALDKRGMPAGKPFNGKRWRTVVALLSDDMEDPF